MVTFYIVRHGHSVANDKGVFAGSSDVDLSEIGYKQAELVGNYLNSNFKFDAIYSSELSRAKNTVLAVSEKQNLPIITNPKFNEIYGGKWEMLPFLEIVEKYNDDFTGWLKNIATSHCTGGESFKQLCERTVDGLTEIAKNNDGKHILIASHAGAIRSMITKIKNLSDEECNSLGWVSNASLTVLTYNKGEFTFEKISYDDYLSELKTTLPPTV